MLPRAGCRMEIPVEKLRILAGLAVLLSFAVSGFAEEDSCRHRTLPVTVVDSVGLPIPGFTPADFQAKFQGKPAQILSVNRDSHPHRVVILLDVSGSMHMQGDKWMMAREVAGDAVAHMPVDTQVALEIFDEKVVEALDFGSGRAALSQKIIDLAPGAKAIPSKSRRTALWDSLSKTVLLFGSSQPGDVVYLISDGGDNVSKTGPRQVENAFLREGIRLFVFLLVSRSTLGYLMPDEEQGLRDLKRLAEATGGNLVGLSRGGPLARLDFNFKQRRKKGLRIWCASSLCRDGRIFAARGEPSSARGQDPLLEPATQPLRQHVPKRP